MNCIFFISVYMKIYVKLWGGFMCDDVLMMLYVKCCDCVYL